MLLSNHLGNMRTFLVFCEKSTQYNPQFTAADPSKTDKRKTLNASVIKNGVYDRTGRTCKTNLRKKDEGKRFPTSILEFCVEGKKNHPTQKPVALCEYLIKTYSDIGNVVLDNTMGSGTTGVACVNTGRRFIGIERDKEYYDVAVNRIQAIPKKLW